jgi:endonuclease/exonuclease/phosphatase family metal-dependent hydrolase
MKRLSVFAVSLLIALSSVASAAELRVMTKNIYLGANLAPAAQATTPGEFAAAVGAILTQVAANNFPERAVALAAEIHEKRPHLVALQEVYDFRFNGSHIPPMFTDFLATLLSALGDTYRVAATVKNIDLALLDPSGNLLTVTDRDVILARNDVATAVVPFAGSGQCRVSEDGCNYHTVVSVDTPVGAITIERGFVAVDATGDFGAVRLANTHLEVRDVAPDPAAVVFQAAQALELVGFLAAFPNPMNFPIIAAGDFNSDPRDSYALDLGDVILTPPYQQMIAAGYIDTWTLRPGNPKGYTCCQNEDLSNVQSVLSERVDLIFTSRAPVGNVMVNTVGNDTEDRTPSGLWPSDHAGVVARLSFE